VDPDIRGEADTGVRRSDRSWDLDEFVAVAE